MAEETFNTVEAVAHFNLLPHDKAAEEGGVQYWLDQEKRSSLYSSDFRGTWG